MMGNLARATYLDTTDHMWPFSTNVSSPIKLPKCRSVFFIVFSVYRFVIVVERSVMKILDMLKRSMPVMTILVMVCNQIEVEVLQKLIFWR